MQQPGEPRLTFLGGAGTVTGSKTLLDTPGGRLLVDCGLFQGQKWLRQRNWEEFPVPPASIDAVLLTHAHLDHCGHLPRLVREGFAGPVYCTEGTRRLVEIILADSGRLQEDQADHANRHGYSKHEPALPLYTEADAIATFPRLTSVAMNRVVDVVPGVEATWQRAGHIVGAATLHVRVHDPGAPDGLRVVFSGDLGRSNHPLLLPPDPIGAADVVVTESTYGDERHPEEDPEQVLAETITRAARHGGVVVIPAFSVDRTEVVLWHLDRLVRAGAVPAVPVFVDSPMALRALDVYEDLARQQSPEIRPEYHHAPLFPSLRFTEVTSTEESKALNDRRGPMIIVSASGMATGGRVVHHLANRVGDPDNAVLLVGFQAPGTRGDSLRRGARTLRMLGQEYPVRARVVSVSLSSHADQDELMTWLGTAVPAPGRVVVNHGEPDATEALVAALARRLRGPVTAARPDLVVRLRPPGPTEGGG